MVRRRRRGAAPTPNDAPALAAALDHAVRCFEKGCKLCVEWEEILDAEGAHGLAQALRTVDLATEGAILATLCFELLEGIRRVRERAPVSTARGQVEDALQGIAKRLGYPLPRPRRPIPEVLPPSRRLKEKAKLVSPKR